MTRLIPTPRNVVRSGDDAPAASVTGYTWRMSGYHQICAGLLATLVAGIGLMPIELQRRIIDDAISAEDGKLLLALAGVYLGVVIAQQALKLLLRVYQGWLSESATLYTRGHVLSVVMRDRGAREAVSAPKDDGSGERVAVITSEIDKLGGFVGDGPSDALSNLATLVGVLAYTFAIEPKIALIGTLLLVPQIVVAPLLQRKVNRLTARRLGLLRDLGSQVSELSSASPIELPWIYSNRMRIHLWKAAMKAVLNLANHLAPLGILLWGGWMVIAGETSLGVLVAFTTGFERMADPARQLIAFYRKYEQAEVQHCMVAQWMRNGGAPDKDARSDC